MITWLLGDYITQIPTCKEVFLVLGKKLEYNIRKKAGEHMIIGIIGAGASGMAAALAASENEKARVLLFERQARVGRKLLATGNGRCNLTNLHAMERGYHGDDPDFAAAALKAMDPKATLSWFAQLGLYTVAEDSGRVYPYSDQANSVVDVLRFALQRPNITLYTGAEVTKVHYRDGSFTVQTEQDSYHCDRLIIACGGLAGTKLGGTMMGYRLLRSLGHSATRLRPALVQLKSGWHGTAALKGIRANCHARILRDGQLYSESTGEIQFTEYGISGPVVFEISRDVCQSAGKWECALDLAPELGNDQLIQMICQRTYAQITAEDLLTGILHNRLGRVIVQAAGIQLQKSAKDVSSQEVEAIVNMIKNFCLELTEPLGMDSAQVTAGGIKTGEFCPDTMESRLVPGLYACGEVLDIDGDCGGYNLQWAWSSGRAAGLHAGEVTV